MAGSPGADWEEAALGDLGIDVAYARMDMVLLGLPGAAERFAALVADGHARVARERGR